MSEFLDMLGFLFIITCPTFLLIVGLCLAVWWFSTRADRRLQREMKRAEIDVIRASTGLVVADANGNYPIKAELLDNPEVVTALLEIALTQQKVKRARKNVPNSVHVVNRDEKEQTMNLSGQQFDPSKLLSDSRSADVLALLTEE